MTSYTVENNTIIGSFVKYNGTYNIVVGTDSTDRLVKILNPVKGNAKLQVLSTNLEFINTPKAPMIEHKWKMYIRTNKGTIISLTTGKVMQWGDMNGDRKDILAAV